MKTFSYKRPQSLAEAAVELGKGGSRISAGGTDLLGTLKDKIHGSGAEAVVSLKEIPGLDCISEEDGTLLIGAMSRLSAIQRDGLIKDKYPMLAEAAHSVASPQLRNMATLGGNICQEPRCWYYRYPGNKFDCLRKGGSSCNAMTGNSKYHSVFGPAKVCSPPCERGCPNGNPIPEYFEMIRRDDIEGAAGVLLDTNPLAAVTGRVCPHECEEGCNRAEYDESVSIREIERYVGDYILGHYEKLLGGAVKKTGKRVAIVGAGPAGLSAAFRLLRAGYEVTIFDACEEPGGMLRYGIPAYRLPGNVVSGVAGMLNYMGAQFRQKVRLGRDISLERLEEEFDAVLLAVGAWSGAGLGCPGEDSIGVLSGIVFLYRAAERRSTGMGKSVAVIGGGNTAMDACRTAKRLGADKVYVLYRRSREQMPADEEEVAAAMEEGVEFMFLVGPAGIESDDRGKVKGVRLQKMELGAPDASGRRRPVPVEGAVSTIEVDTVINAVGQSVDPEGIEPVFSSEKGTIDAGEGNRTGRDKVFAAGDAAAGPATVVEAMADAGKAADGIISFLGGPKKEPSAKKGGMLRFDSGCLDVSGRIRPLVKPVAKRKRFDEDAQTAPAADIGREAARCLNCGCAASSPSDMAPAIIALGGEIITTKRTVPAGEFFCAGACSSTVLEAGEIVTGVRIPQPAEGSVQSYNKFRYRKSVDFPVIGVAACFDMKEGGFGKASIVLGVFSPLPGVLCEVDSFIEGK
ncbi:MAG: FAD binding domain-containing protein, partial [Clostridiales bacterium]|nr:FAD binding domain-containing protein [Clostridiales bacterium]